MKVADDRLELAEQGIVCRCNAEQRFFEIMLVSSGKTITLILGNKPGDFPADQLLHGTLLESVQILSLIRFYDATMPATLSTAYSNAKDMTGLYNMEVGMNNFLQVLYFQHCLTYQLTVISRELIRIDVM